MSQETSSTTSPLDAVSPIDGRYHILTEQLAPYFSEGALIRTRVEVEARYLIALSHTGVVRPLTPAEETTLLEIAPNLTSAQFEQIQVLEATTQHDVKAVEKGIGQFIKGTSLEDITEMIHFALTSEDVNNLAYRLMISRARDAVMVPALQLIVDDLTKLAQEHKATPMLARTHGQPAVPTTLGKEMVNFALRLQKQIRSIQDQKLAGKLNGAVGNFNSAGFAAPEVDWIKFSQEFIQSLGLESNMITTQINSPDDVIELMQAFQRANGAVLDLDLDMWRYISDGWFVQQPRAGEVGSSTMPQKVNPIRFENSEAHTKMATDQLESLSRHLATSRLQRDLSGSAVMRYIGEALAKCLIGYNNTRTGLQRTQQDLTALSAALHADVSILAEGAQTLLRRIGVPDAYGKVAALSRGRQIRQDEWGAWVDSLPIDEVDEETKASLRSLSVENYLGKAEELTEIALAEIAELKAI